MLNNYIRECRRQTNDQNTWATYKTFLHQAHREQSRAVTTAEKGGYATVVQNIYGVPPPHTEEHHEAVDNLNTTVQGMQT